MALSNYNEEKNNVILQTFSEARQKAKEKQAQSQIALTILLYAKITGLLQRTIKQRILAQELGRQSQIICSRRPKPFWQVLAVVGACWISKQFELGTLDSAKMILTRKVVLVPGEKVGRKFNRG